MVMEKRLCPYGLQAKDLLEWEGFTVGDHWPTTRKEADAFKREHRAEATPQVSIGPVGAWSVFKAVQLDKREPECPCVGRSGDVLLGIVSLMENLTMNAMAVWMGTRALGV